jgi:hypothetical protein
MNTSTNTPMTGLRMPRQAPGVHRGTGVTAAVAAAGGVEAAGLFTWLFGDSDATRALDDAGNGLLSLSPITSAIAQMASPFIP